ncbi:MAG: hypothetical protein BroJett026_21790 [Betaproteobacteria bacterium]|nr:MAG: hypothetical protein BroJett026_21790 [Betaproteobacteria bacterium]
MARHDDAWGGVLAAALAGAVAMYLLDPDKGRRRRAIARDRTLRALRQVDRVLDAASSDARQRARGLAARTRRLAAPAPAPDDLQLIERVRARLGRVCSHPHAIHVGALDGRVTVSGPILAAEAAPLLAAIRAVPGVGAVDEHLVVHHDPGSVPALQGGRPAVGAHRTARWTPALRVAAVFGGTLLAVVGTRGGPLAWLAAAGGALCAVRGATDRPLASLLPPPAAPGRGDEPPQHTG